MTWDDLRNSLTSLPLDLPSKGVPPGDLERFAPDGLGLAAPLIVRPYGTMADPDFYGWHERVFDPFKGAPRTNAEGGVLYFSDYLAEGALDAALTLMGVALKAPAAEFVAFEDQADDPVAQRFLRQIRLMPRASLANVFGADTPEATTAAARVSIGDVIAGFVEAERAYWYRGGGTLEGTLGGDGDWAKEHLGFGFLVENAYWSIYRLWSRPYLVTK
jgi:hypothetical protein